MAAQGDQRGCADIHRISPQGQDFDHISTVADPAGCHQRNTLPDALIAQTLIYLGNGHFNGDADVVTDTHGSSPGGPAKTVDSHYVGSGSDHT